MSSIYVFPFATSVDCFWVNPLHAFWKIAYVWNCFWFWNLEFGFWPLICDFFLCSRKPIAHSSHYFGGHLNNVSEPYFLMEPPLRKLNDECSVGWSWILWCRVVIVLTCLHQRRLVEVWVKVVWSLWSRCFGSETSFLDHYTALSFPNT